MAKKQLTTRADSETHSAVKRLQEDRHESMSKATEEAVGAGLQRMGYLDGGSTPARRLTETVATGVFHVGATLLLLSLFGPAAFFGMAMGALLGSLALAVVARGVIPRYEPHISNQIPTVEVSRHGG